MTDNTVQCPFCDTQSKFGLRVCTGCQATIVYGATQTELTNTLKQTAMGVSGVSISVQRKPTGDLETKMENVLAVIELIGVLFYGLGFVRVIH